jgi:hypothetical protein
MIQAKKLYLCKAIHLTESKKVFAILYSKLVFRFKNFQRRRLQSCFFLQMNRNNTF